MLYLVQKLLPPVLKIGDLEDPCFYGAETLIAVPQIAV